MAVTVRSITDAGGFHAVEELQRAVWSMPDLEVVPLHQLRAAVSAGGVLLGAFDERGTLVGFCYGFSGLRDGGRMHPRRSWESGVATRSLRTSLPTSTSPSCGWRCPRHSVTSRPGRRSWH